MKIVKVEKTEAGTGEITMDYAEQTFKELLAFQGYGFCLGYDVPVIEQMKGEIPIGKLAIGDLILTPGDEKGERWERVNAVMPQGKKDLYKIDFSNGRFLNITTDHVVLCSDGCERSIEEILKIRSDGGDCKIMFRGLNEASIIGMEYLGQLPVMDIEISGKRHLFYANDCIVHNCKAHATSYSVYSAVQMWLQEHYFLEYMCALLNHIDRAKEKKGVGVLNERVEYCINHGTTIYYPDVTRSTDKWEIVAGGLLAPLKNIKGFSDREVKIITEGRDYTDLRDFLDKTKFNKNRFEALLFAHALDKFGDIPTLYEYYYNDYANENNEKKKPKKVETFDLFSLDEPQEEPEAPRVMFTLSKVEVEDKCLDMNGFIIQDNIRIKYHEFYERGMAKVVELKHNEDYNSPRRRIYTLSDVKNEDVEEDKYKNRWVLAKVTNVVRGLVGKTGSKFDKLEISDGYTKIVIMGSIPQVFKKGRVMIFPVSINDNQKIKIGNMTMSKLDPVILEDAQ